MRRLSEMEIISLTAMLEMEKDGLIVTKAMNTIISDPELKKQAEYGVLAVETRIKSIQQFINENQVSGTGEVQ
jgi:hypothetical protein